MTTAIDQLAVLQTECERIAELARTHDLTTPVPHLGRWKVRDVVAHLGGVHRWASRIVNTRSRSGPGFTKSKLDGVALCDWFDEGASELLDTLGSNDHEDECPNFNPGSENTVAWWVRRQLHETTIHRWDIERAVDSTTAIDSTIAADGIDEYLDVFVRTRGKQTLSAPLLLTTTRPKRAWTLTPATKPGRIDIEVGQSVEPTTHIAGKPDQLLLGLWRRLSLAEAKLVITGNDADAAAIAGLPD